MNNTFSFHSILKQCKMIHIYQYSFYHWNSFLQQIKIKAVRLEKNQDIFITPFYVQNGKLYECYDFELRIRYGPDRLKEYLLALTGKQRYSDIPDVAIEKYSKCYIDGTEADISSMNKKLLEYFLFVRDNEEIKDTVCKYYSDFDNNNLYFEYYEMIT